MKKNGLKISCIVIAILAIIIGVLFTFQKIKANKAGDSDSSIVETTETTTETTTAVTTTETTIETTTETIVENTTSTGLETTTVSTTDSEQTNTVLDTTTETAASTEAAVSICATPLSYVVNECKTNTKKSIEEIAKEVWSGKWGVYPERKLLLEAAGYNYQEVQTVVNNYVPEEIKTEIGIPIVKEKNFVKTYTKGTYYCYNKEEVYGGSGRRLIDCSIGNVNVKGSIASWDLYSRFGYNHNGERTIVYLKVKDYPQMNGCYYLDDSCAPGYNNVIDFFFYYATNCPFQYQGVVEVDCYIIE